MKFSIAALVSLVVPFVSVGSVSANTINLQEMEHISRNAYMRTYEAKVCIDAIANRRPEMALGFCYSWYAQALDDREKKAAELMYSTALHMIDSGIASERD